MSYTRAILGTVGALAVVAQLGPKPAGDAATPGGAAAQDAGTDAASATADASAGASPDTRTRSTSAPGAGLEASAPDASPTETEPDASNADATASTDAAPADAGAAAKPEVEPPPADDESPILFGLWAGVGYANAERTNLAITSERRTIDVEASSRDFYAAGGLVVGPLYGPVWLAGELNGLGTDWLSAELAPRFPIIGNLRGILGLGLTYADATRGYPESLGVAWSAGAELIFARISKPQTAWREQSLARIERLEAAYREECLDNKSDDRCKVIALEIKRRLELRECPSTPSVSKADDLSDAELLEVRLFSECRAATSSAPEATEFGALVRYEGRHTEYTSAQGGVLGLSMRF